ASARLATYAVLLSAEITTLEGLPPVGTFAVRVLSAVANTDSDPSSGLIIATCELSSVIAIVLERDTRAENTPGGSGGVPGGTGPPPRGGGALVPQPTAVTRSDAYRRPAILKNRPVSSSIWMASTAQRSRRSAGRKRCANRGAGRRYCM